MYGFSRTSSFGFTMKLLTYHDSRPTTTYVTPAGTTAAAIQRMRGAATALTSAMTAPSTSAPDTASMPVSVTCASV